MRTATDYLAQLQALAPIGAAWPREGETTLNAVLEGLAEEFARIDARGQQLLTEIDPREVSELLEDWERAWGLPDGCVVAEPTVEGRRLALHQRVASLGGQSAEYFVGLSALLGYETEVENFRPSRIALTLPAPIAGRPWAFAWRLVVHGPAQLGGAEIYASADLECVVDRVKPAHTVVSFDWSPDPAPTLHFDFLNPPD
jgi:uncharacterized protein YmfQ (DUF2313 family)